MLNVPKRANDAMHMSMLDGYDVSGFINTSSLAIMSMTL